MGYDTIEHGFTDALLEQFELLLALDQVFRVPSGMEDDLPELPAMCPEVLVEELGLTLQQLYDMAKLHETNLANALTMKEWLKAMVEGKCDEETFVQFMEDNQPACDETRDAIDAVLRDLFELRENDDGIFNNFAEEFALFSAEIEAQCAADPNQPMYVSPLVVPLTSPACPPAVLTAHAAAMDFLDEDIRKNRYLLWLEGRMSGHCAMLNSQYNAMYVIQSHRLDPLEMERDLCLHALWMFKGEGAD
jgi:hypothetical protein